MISETYTPGAEFSKSPPGEWFHVIWLKFEHHRNRYCAQAAYADGGGVVRHEAWCISGVVTLFPDDNKKYLRNDLLLKEPMQPTCLTSNVDLVGLFSNGTDLRALWARWDYEYPGTF